MAGRHREYDVPTLRNGSLWTALGNVTTMRNGKDLVQGSCDDYVGHWWGDNALQLRKVFTRVAVLNGEEWHYQPDGTPVLLAKYADCPSYWQPSPKSMDAIWPDPTEGDLLAMAPEIVSQANPSAAHISAPTFVGELGDIPGGIRDLIGLKDLSIRSVKGVPQALRNFGKAALRSAAMGYISWRWAVKPMIHDVKTMLTFADAAKRRFELLSKLATESSVRMRVKLESLTSDDDEDVWLETARAVVSAKRQTHYEKSSWATVRWRMNEVSADAFRAMDVQSQMAYADRLAAGITSQEALATMWELTPWSWFSDWFGNIGDTIAACNNTAGAYPISICYMCTRTSRSTYTITSKSPWVEVSNSPQEQLVRKGRWLVPLYGYHIPSFGMPVLTDRQWSILGALACLKGIRAR